MKGSYQTELDRHLSKLADIITRGNEIKARTHAIKDCISKAATRIHKSQALIEQLKES